MNHSIFISFQGSSKYELEKFREQHDSLSKKIEAHVTILFPYSNDLNANEGIRVVDALSNHLEFNFEISNKITYEQELGYLQVIKNQDAFITLYIQAHKMLNLTSRASFVPHVTVVRDSVNKPEYVSLSSLQYKATSVVLECFGHDGKSNVVYSSAKRI